MQSTASRARCSIPLRQLPEQLGALPKDQPVVVHCQVGGRSALAVAMLRSQGYDAHNLSGGIQAWEALDRSIDGKSS